MKSSLVFKDGMLQLVTKSAGELIAKSRLGVARGVVVPSKKKGMVTTQKPKEKKVFFRVESWIL
jgi:hypothetical protein